ncbi:hypothetical protein JCM9140_1210 [Halalkalibacter wakoensis JCM 9140]|uniref:GerMN domain-containing protein n=1 Tax=Halalkalibacter wakoensis JCM 9140 TaxID=1236970 RepID=W4PZV7_9BACI|nr:GerMN domain-containing protein [Halalkalibacter wakoensis]GAE25230.1 hypothetical protein JCM9140_1210 [Halalkalibacter wakoensis JCM 9140]
MKKNGMYVILAFFILFLGACGQGTASNGDQQVADEVENDEHTELDEEQEEVHEDVDNEGETGEAEESESQDEVPTDETEVKEEVTVTPIELVFSDDQVMDMYRVERQLEVSDEELFKATIEAWVSGPTEEGLVSLLPDGVHVQSVEEKEGVAHVSFSNELLEANVGSGTEFMLLQQIAMAMKQFGFNETQILVNGEIHSELFGHVDTSVPVVAENPEDYEKR